MAPAGGENKMTVNVYDLMFSFGAGILIGLFYFGGLWWMVNRLTVLRNPVLWVTGSFLVRAALSLSGFYFAAGGQWQGMLFCLIGFVLVRMCWVTNMKSGRERRKVVLREG
jgi:F1F0 ATPase subunit 2